MSATRWLKNNYLPNNRQFDSDENRFEEILLSSVGGLDPVEENSEEFPLEVDSSVALPETLPILPLRGLVVYPQTLIPLTIGQPRSIRLVDDVVSGNRMIGLVTAKNPELENPNPEDLFTVGAVGMVHRLFRAQDGTIRLLVQGITRFKVIEYNQS